MSYTSSIMNSSRGCKYVKNKLVFRFSHKWLIDQHQINTDSMSKCLKSLSLIDLLYVLLYPQLQMINRINADRYWISIDLTLIDQSFLVGKTTTCLHPLLFIADDILRFFVHKYDHHHCCLDPSVMIILLWTRYWRNIIYQRIIVYNFIWLRF